MVSEATGIGVAGESLEAGRASRMGVGNSRLNLVPRPTSLCTLILPPWASTILRVVGKPSPEPSGLVE